MSLLYCEAGGARVFLANVGLSQQGTDFQVDLTTWDVVPSGEVGDNSFRTIDVSGSCTNGYSIAIQPIVDGVVQNEQTFSGSGTGEFTCQAFLAKRGARIAARVRTLSRSGEIELHNISTSFVALRRVP